MDFSEVKMNVYIYIYIYINECIYLYIHLYLYMHSYILYICIFIYTFIYILYIVYNFVWLRYRQCSGWKMSFIFIFLHIYSIYSIYLHLVKIKAILKVENEFHFYLFFSMTSSPNFNSDFSLIGPREKMSPMHTPSTNVLSFSLTKYFMHPLHQSLCF